MHEISLALEIRSICEAELARLPEGRVTAVGVEVGAFSGVEVDTLRFCLEAVMGERFDGVSVQIEREPGRARCSSCDEEFEVSSAPFDCPRCGSIAYGVEGGGSLRVSYLEVE